MTVIGTQSGCLQANGGDPLACLNACQRGDAKRRGSRTAGKAAGLQVKLALTGRRGADRVAAIA